MSSSRPVSLRRQSGALRAAPPRSRAKSDDPDRVSAELHDNARTRRLTVLGQDPSITLRNGDALTVQVEVPMETLAPGPRGSRVHVVDFDASTNTFYRPYEISPRDKFEKVRDVEQLIRDPGFHAQNVWSIVMSTLFRFERALGRRASWALPGGGSYPGAAPGRGHVLKVAPHAFAEANAFYSRRDEGLLFGYFPSRSGGYVFSCLSHDVVVHETTHALLDGLRPRFSEPSSPDQAAFHEGFSDIVALLSVFRHKRVIDTALTGLAGKISPDELTPEALRSSLLLGLADQMGSEMSASRGDALRRSAELKPRRGIIDEPEFEDPHRRGEILVAAIMNAFLEVWTHRLGPLGLAEKRPLDRARVIEEGAAAADHLLTMAIRAMDYTPPVDLHFSDFLTALLTADTQLYPDDRFNYRDAVTRWCAAYGIHPVPTKNGGLWEPPPEDFSLARNHFESLRSDPDEAFKCIWENRELLKLDPEAYTWVSSVRPVTRVDVDGFFLRETVIEYVQLLDLRAEELAELKLKCPKGMPSKTRVRLNGGGVLVFDEFGQLKFHINSNVVSDKQSDRLNYLWRSGFFSEKRAALRRFARLHLERGLDRGTFAQETW